ncbi:pathogenesis-like transcriptional factor and ERF protein [Sphingomonas sp. LH128]|uniref:HNH endonuclease n=1 Tax=Sphingomonas sp. LH128 TaxID=473781 RepID=UPI00027C9B13|nr:HNH endonuclease [Sphingomonas sp. LH128]EJU14120.1 pathogenesis-like transcriptional factor and ERF protein [Sphingomonas sp. LH128]
MKPRPTPAELRQLLRYEPETGKLFWLPRTADQFPDRRSFSTWTSRFCGKEAFISITPDGYKYGGIWGVKHYAHRVIWAILHGEWPPNDVDHINGDRADNRLCNLRAATRAENLRNTGARPHNRLGVKGVTLLACGKYRAEIKAPESKRHLGRFDTLEEARAAYNAAVLEAHGEFARLS